MAKILVAGLNPAWQHVIFMSALNPGTVHRAEGSASLASGKGLNAAKVLAKMGHDVSVLQILAGENGNRCLKACEEWKLRSLGVMTAGETRQCTTLLSEDGSATEIIEPFTVTESGVEKKLSAVLEKEAGYDALVVCGSVPQGISPFIYHQILKAVKASTVVWDSVIGLDLETMKRISWIKVNAEEFSKLSAHGAAWPATLITGGSKPAKVFYSPSANGSYALPTLTQIRNPIGAGDTVTAMLTDGLLRGLGEENSVKRALACGAASCLMPLPAEFNLEDASALESGIRRGV